MMGNGEFVSLGPRGLGSLYYIFHRSLIRIDKNWSSLIIIDQNWSSLIRIDLNWSSLIRIWSSLILIHQNWSELIRTDPIKSSQCAARKYLDMFFVWFILFWWILRGSGPMMKGTLGSNLLGTDKHVDPLVIEYQAGAWAPIWHPIWQDGLMIFLRTSSALIFGFLVRQKPGRVIWKHERKKMVWNHIEV